MTKFTDKQFKVENLKTRLDKFLAEQLPQISRSQIQREIESGLVAVNEKVVKESKFVVRKNDRVKYEIKSGKSKAESIEAVNRPLKILYNNHGLLIIDKPPGLTVHPGAGFKGETLVSALLFQFKEIKTVGEEHRPGIVHRLDKDTSGVMLVAKTQEMYEYLKEDFAQKKIKKIYIALVLGKVEKPHGFIDLSIGQSKTDFRKQTTKNPKEAKEALTEYQVLEYLTNDNYNHNNNGTNPLTSLGVEIQSKGNLDIYTLIRVKLHSGRTHQIRVHMSALGHPLLGDSLYGGKKTELKGLKRQFLHAKSIEVQLPEKIWIEAESELPSDLKEILVNLNSKVVNNL